MREHPDALWKPADELRAHVAAPKCERVVLSNCGDRIVEGIAQIGLKVRTRRTRDTFGRIYEHFLSRYAQTQRRLNPTAATAETSRRSATSPTSRCGGWPT